MSQPNTLPFRLRTVALAAAAVGALAGTAPAAIDLDAPPPTDPAVVTGTLPNGLTYYIRSNPKPEDRVELRLGVNVGSVQETDEERGLAHFNEHMNFNGTANFAPGELVDYLESIGARFGADSNAYTSFDETVYFLQVPTDKPGALESGLTIMADWAGRALLTGEEIDKERGVVADELRRGKGAFKRIYEKQQELIFHGSRYAERMTIGLEDIILNAPHETVRGFYRRWYRPENVGLAIVGTIDAREMEARVKEIFSALPATPAGERVEIPTFDVPPHEETLYSVESDPELTSSSVSVLYKHPYSPPRNGREMRDSWIDSLAGYLLTLRLSERAQSEDPPFLRAGAGYGGYVKTMATFSLNASAKDGELARAARALVEELVRARRHGFVESELDRVKAGVLKSAESSYKERDQRRSRGLAGQAIRSYLADTPLTSAEWDYEFVKQVVPTITLDEVNAALRRRTAPGSRVVTVRAPEKEGAVPTVDEIRSSIQSAESSRVEAYVDDAAGRDLMARTPTPGRILSRHAIPELGIEEVRLSNGILVVLKQTDFRNDEIRMTAFKHGGVAALPREDWQAAWRADTLAGESGLGAFTAPQLRKLLADKQAFAGVNISRFTLGAGGSATPEDVETMFQLLHMRFTQPAFREDAFERILDREKERLQNALNSPNGVYGRTVSRIAYDGHPLYMPATMDDIEQLRMEDLERTYRTVFADAAGWTFVLVGNLDFDRELNHLETYVASLPSTWDVARDDWPEPDLSYHDLHVGFPVGKTTRVVAKGIEDQSRTSLMIWAPWNIDPDESFRIGAMTDLLRIRLRERLREERGDTYGVGVGSSSLAPYPHYGRINVSWGSAPDKRESMLRDVLDEIRRVKRDLPSPEDVSKLKELRYNSLSEAVKENGYWLSQLRSSYTYGRDPRRILGAHDRIDRLNAKTIRSTARKYLKLDRTATVFLVPEDWGFTAWLTEPAAAGMGASTGLPQGM